MVTQTHRSIENLSQATPVLAILGLGSLFLPAPALHCTRCEQQKAKKKGDDAGAAA
jgi:hypothetical protein